ncbi:MAG: RDD family protein [Saprospiraceae bacterium]
MSMGRWEDGKIGRWGNKKILLSSYPLIFLLIIIFNFNTAAQVSVGARLDSTRILIGDQVKMHIQLNAPGNVRVQPPDLTVFDSLQGVEIVDTTAWDTLQRGANYILEQELTLTSFDSGVYILPRIPVTYLQNGKIGIAETNTLRLEVSTIPIASDTVQLAPIKPIIQEPRTLEDLVPYLIPLLIIIIIGCIIYLIVNRKKKPKVVAPPKPLLPHEIALQKLVTLQQQNLWQKGEVKQYQTELTFIIREYLENRFKIPALESTTDEIVQNLRKTDIEERWRDRLQELFVNADLVKFAKAQPPMTIHEQGMQEAIHFTWETKPIQEVVTIDEVSQNETVTNQKKELQLDEYLYYIEQNPVKTETEDIADYKVEYADFGHRFVAVLIDAVIISVTVIAVGFIVFSFLTQINKTPGADAFATVGVTIYLALPILSWLYFAIFESSEKQATPGKKVFNIRVTDLNGNRISFGRATVRHLGKIISFLTVYIGFLMALYTKRKQALHDMISNCLVMEAKKQK